MTKQELREALTDRGVNVVATQAVLNVPHGTIITTSVNNAVFGYPIGSDAWLKSWNADIKVGSVLEIAEGENGLIRLVSPFRETFDISEDVLLQSFSVHSRRGTVTGVVQ